MQRNNFESLAGAIGAVKQDVPGIEIKHFAPAGQGLARVVARVIHTAASRVNPGLIAQALLNKTDNRLSAVAGSFRVMDRGPLSDTVTGILSYNRESIAVASSDDMKGFTAVASNMFMDDEERMWNLHKTESGSLLVRSSGIDDDQALIGLLASLSSSPQTSTEGRQLTAMASSLRDRVEGGQFVSFVNANNMLAHGFVVVTAADTDDAIVLTGEKDEPEAIKTNSVTEIHELGADAPQVELSEQEQVDVAVASAAGRVSLDMMVDYYRRMFAASPEYFEQFKQRLLSHGF